jgi:allantoate deiminase
MKNFSERAFNIQQRINELNAINHGDQLFGSQGFIDLSQKIAGWMEAAGLETTVDNIGNLRGKLKSDNLAAKTFVIGSHTDPGIYGDKNDGRLGILIGLDLIENSKLRHAQPPFNLELIGFVEEEGTRFNYNYLGSKVVTGKFENKLLRLADENNNSLSDVLNSLQLHPEKIKEDAVAPEDIIGYFEIHLEPGNILADAGVPVGVVDSMCGQKRIEIIFSGKPGHTGSLAMNERNDALAAAAKFILQVEKYAKREKRKLLATVGKIEVRNPASNQIASKVSCSLDIRGDNEELLSEAYENIYFLCEKTCDKRNIYFEWKLIQETEPATCNKKLRRLLEEAVAEKNIRPVSIESGAVYDAAIMAKVVPTALLFLKSANASNHHNPEDEEKNNIAKALEVSDLFLQKIISAPDRSFRKKEK